MHKPMEKRLAQAEQLCKQAGVRLTDIRRDLLALIYAHGEHLTAYELLRLLRDRYPKAEAMTVYRVLYFLQKQHLIHRVARACRQFARLRQNTLIFEHCSAAYLSLCEQRSTKNRRIVPSIVELTTGPSQNAYTACDTPEHSHHAQLLLCEKWGQAEEISATSLEKALQKMAEQYQFSLSNNPVEITGTCKNCIG